MKMDEYTIKDGFDLTKMAHDPVMFYFNRQKEPVFDYDGTKPYEDWQWGGLLSFVRYLSKVKHNPYPGVFMVVWNEAVYTVSVHSNSTQASKEITFNLTRVSSTAGFCNVTIPKILLRGPWKVLVDGSQASYNKCENESYTALYFIYTHDRHKVQIIGTEVIEKGHVPPISSDNYDGMWHNADFTMTLTAADSESGVAETYFEINDGPTQTVSEHGQPLITWESANNTLEYWSVDKAGNEETPHKVLTGIKLDKTSPTVLIASPSPGYEIGSSAVTVTWTGSDEISGIDHYEIRLDGGSWTSVGTSMTDTLAGLGDGSHTIDIRAVDKAGNTEQGTVNFTVNTSLFFGPNHVGEVVILATIIMAFGVIIYLLKIREHTVKRRDSNSS
jgi:hypothetical protein